MLTHRMIKPIGLQHRILQKRAYNSFPCEINSLEIQSNKNVFKSQITHFYPAKRNDFVVEKIPKMK